MASPKLAPEIAIAPTKYVNVPERVVNISLESVQNEDSGIWPAYPEHEAAVIGSAMESSACFYSIQTETDLKPEHFSTEANRRVYASLLEMAQKHFPIAPLSVHAVSGVDLSTIADAVCGVILLPDRACWHARKVVEAWKLQEILLACDWAKTSCSDFHADPVAISMQLRERLETLCQ